MLQSALNWYCCRCSPESLLPGTELPRLRLQGRHSRGLFFWLLSGRLSREYGVSKSRTPPRPANTGDAPGGCPFPAASGSVPPLPAALHSPSRPPQRQPSRPGTAFSPHLRPLQRSQSVGMLRWSKSDYDIGPPRPRLRPVSSHPRRRIVEPVLRRLRTRMRNLIGTCPGCPSRFGETGAENSLTFNSRQHVEGITK